ncbi:MAG: hypothetical protein HQL11_03060, partial [Candidatus Omnitrophica bacterium]|nr:hypothetical protein [Candidatus Omnitrophota bacterium]
EMLEVGTPQQIQNSKNAILRQFVEGEAEGPVRFVQQGDRYLEGLTDS